MLTQNNTMPLNRLSSKVSRRTFFAAGSGAIAAGLSTNLLIPKQTVAAPPAIQTTALSGEQALKRLMDGNQRYLLHKLTHLNQDEQRLVEIAKGQHPFAIVLSCADSRVPPEIVFDQGLGDLFVVRVAGNIVDDAILGSIEFAATQLNVPLVVVLGHERCGAVAAAVKGGEVPAHINALTKAIQPAVNKVRGKAGDLLDNAVRANVELVVQQIKTSAPLVELVTNKKLKIVGGRYDLDQGAVEMIA